MQNFLLIQFGFVERKAVSSFGKLIFKISFYKGRQNEIAQLIRSSHMCTQCKAFPIHIFA